MRLRYRRALLALGLFMSLSALASQAGFRSISIPGLPESPEAIPAALYYPTQATEQSIPMGPFTSHVAMRAAPEARVKGLIVLSHGTGGTELGHGSLAEALARDGYLVAALRHPGDNWQDKSLLSSAPRYFTERPRQASRVIDALLQDPDWKDRIATDAKGPRVGAVGHSAGGYTVLALAGGRPDLERRRVHCDTHGAEDPIFCSVGRTARPAPQGEATGQAIPPLADARVRAVVALAPVGAVFTAKSLSEIAIPTLVYEPELDRFLVPRFHAEWIAQNVPRVELHRIQNAWHFAPMDTPGAPIASADGDIGADPPGFDRAAFLKQIGNEIPAFFDRVFP